MATGRSRHGLLTVPASTGPAGVPRVAGHPWTTVEANQIMQAYAGVDSQLAAYAGPERFDVLNLLVATDGAVRAFGHDVRRLRPNLLISGVLADAEGTWPGRALAIGDALIGIHSLRGRSWSRPSTPTPASAMSRCSAASGISSAANSH